ncbi:7TM diverse intracellular signaling domain-containing protein [Alteromonadaceae bacterium BrNp21-10]|nr:7TM diverse intracellular signaling domain-containing protein [Alteromonadaceae bacterium BrNp21-10]
MKRYWRLLFCLLLMMAPQAFGQSAVQLTNTDETIRLTRYIKVLHEPAGRLDIEDVIARKKDFEWPIGSNPNYGFSKSGLWLTVSVSNVTSVRNWAMDIASAQNDSIDFYLVHGNTVLKHVRAGKIDNTQVFRFPTLEVELLDATPVDFYIRVQTSDVTRIVPVDIQSHAQHSQNIMLDTVFWGMFYGGLLMLAIYNLVFYVKTKVTSTLAYIFYLAAVMLWQFVWGGHLQLLFSGEFINWLSVHTGLLFLLVGSCAAIFTITFLNAQVTAPRSLIVIQVILFCFALLSILIFADVFEPKFVSSLVYGLSSIAISSYLIAGFESYAHPYSPARYFIFAWSIVLTSALVGMLSLLGIFPTNVFTAYCFHVGVMCEAALFSIAIMDKSRHEMESEIASYTREMRHNLELIEEQNVHLDIARKDAVKASKVKSQFLANMSHEIRTPLNAILGFSKELQSSHIDSAKQEQAQIINVAANNLLGIINDILDLSKIEAGKLEVHNEPFSANQLLDELIGLMSKTAQDKNLIFIYEPCRLPDKLIGDAARIRQVLTNLLGNAIKFTSSGHVKLIVTCKKDRSSMWLYFTVEDTGIGISSNKQKALFSAFSQVDDALNRQFQGTGLGLVISQQLTQMMHGEVTLESDIGKGSRFTASIRTQILTDKQTAHEQIRWRNKRIKMIEPYQPAMAAAKKLFKQLDAIVVEDDFAAPIDFLFVSCERTPSQELIAEVKDTDAHNKYLLHPSRLKTDTIEDYHDIFDGNIEKPLLASKLERLFTHSQLSPDDKVHKLLSTMPPIKILAVDDMELNLRLISTWLKPSPILLSSSLSGQDAFTRCEKEEFDLILMDVQMPNMDGLQASQLIRQTELNSGTPIVAVTAHAFKEEQERLLASGMDDYLPKPIDLTALIELIQRWCHIPEQPQPQTIDWQSALEQSNENPQLANDMLEAFIQQLPDLQQEINKHAAQSDIDGLKSSIHKLHGVCCYTGVPKLQEICHDIEVALKQSQTVLALDKIPAFNNECHSVIELGRQQLTKDAT